MIQMDLDEIKVKNEIECNDNEDILEPEITVKTEEDSETNPENFYPSDFPCNPDALLLLNDPAKKIKRCSYSMDYKLQIIEKAKETNNRSVARSEDLNESLVRQWRKNEQKIRQAVSQQNSDDPLIAIKGSKARFRLDGGGKKSMYTDLEEKVFQWVLECRKNGVKITRRLIRAKALEMSQIEQIDQKFSASEGWCHNFIKRYNLSTTDQVPLGPKGPKILNFYRRFRQLIKSGNVHENFHLDEMSLPLGSFTIFVILCASAKTKFKPMVIFNGLEKNLEDKKLELNENVDVSFSDDGKINEAQICQFINFNFSSNSENSLLIWDDFKYHLTSYTQDALRCKSVENLCVPEECSGQLLATESWSQKFKTEFIDKIREHYTENICLPTKSKICEMIDVIWQAKITQEFIQNSFENVGQNPDSQPEDIKILKDDLTLNSIHEQMLEFWDDPTPDDEEWTTF